MKRFPHIIFIGFTLCTFQTEAFTQNVGIGNSSPSEKLDVAGNVKADTLKSNVLRMVPNAGTGKVLTSDAMGNGKWEPLSLDSDEVDNGNLGFGVWGDCQTNNNITAYQPVADTAGMIDDQFGTSVDINGDYAIIGSIDDDVQYPNQGSASIYHHNGTEWVFVQKLTDPNAYEYDRLGTDVAISGNYAFVGAWEDDETYINQGSVCVFQFDGSSWVFLQKLVDPDGATNDLFGNSIAVDGNFLIVGVLLDDLSYTDQGSAIIFQLNGNNWEYFTKLYDATGAANDWYGTSVSISANRVVIGAKLDDDGAQDKGSALIYQYDGSSWNLQQKIYDPGGGAYDAFGSSATIQGDRILIGSPQDQVQFTGQGSACFFAFNGTSWLYVHKVNDNNGGMNDYFGTSVAMSGNYALIGTLYDSQDNDLNVGSAIIFQKVGASWIEYQEIFDPAGTIYSYFGSTCDLDSTTGRFVIGSYGSYEEMGKVVFGMIRE